MHSQASHVLLDRVCRMFLAPFQIQAWSEDQGEGRKTEEGGRRGRGKKEKKKRNNEGEGERKKVDEL